MTPAQLARIEDPPDPLGNEAAFQSKLLKLLRAHGWRCTHNPPRPGRSRHITFGDPGFPDVVALRPPDLVFLECKSVGGKTSEEQRVWLVGLEAAGVDAWVVNPADWPVLVRLARDGIEAISIEQETV